MKYILKRKNPNIHPSIKKKSPKKEYKTSNHKHKKKYKNIQNKSINIQHNNSNFPIIKSMDFILHYPLSGNPLIQAFVMLVHVSSYMRTRVSAIKLRFLEKLEYWQKNLQDINSLIMLIMNMVYFKKSYVIA